MKYARWGLSFVSELFDGTASHTEPRIKIKNITKPLKVNIWKKNDPTNHSTFKTDMENEFAPNMVLCIAAVHLFVGSFVFAMKNWTEFLLFAWSSPNYLCFDFETPVPPSITQIISKFNHLITVWGKARSICKSAQHFPFAWTHGYAIWMRCGQ